MSDQVVVALDVQACTCSQNVEQISTIRGSRVRYTGMIRRALQNIESQLSNAPRVRSKSQFPASISSIEVMPISGKSQSLLRGRDFLSRSRSTARKNSITQSSKQFRNSIFCFSLKHFPFSIFILTIEHSRQKFKTL